MKKLFSYITLLLFLLAPSLGYALIGEIFDTTGKVVGGTIDTAGKVVTGTIDTTETVATGGRINRRQERRDRRVKAENLHEEEAPQKEANATENDDELYKTYGGYGHTYPETPTR